MCPISCMPSFSCNENLITQVDNASSQGDMEGAYSYSCRAKYWKIAGIVAGLLLVLITGVVVGVVFALLNGLSTR